MLTHVVEQMATKDDVRTIVKTELDERLTPITDELVTIRRDLDHLARSMDNVIGYRKEIDHALERIAAIEKHLGIKHKLAA